MAKNDKKYYAVKVGRETGIFETWEECHKHTHKFPGKMYKSFLDKKSAETYMKNNKARFSERHNSAEEIMGKLEDGECLAYVDGSNTESGDRFSWGIVLFTNNEKVDLSGCSKDERFIKHRNISGELFASVNAADYAMKNNLKKIIIYHDFSGIRHWALGEWKTKSDLAKHYKKFYEKAMKNLEVEFVKADGHTGDKFNEEADVLAKKASGVL